MKSETRRKGGTNTGANRLPIAGQSSQTALALVLTLLLPAALRSAEPRATVADWLSLQLGDRWTYQVEIRDGDRNHPEVTTWVQEDSTIAINRIPEGIVVRRAVKLVNGTGTPYSMNVDEESNILIRHGCLYYLNDSGSYGHGYAWNARRQELTAKFRHDLVTGQALPDVCPPLIVGKQWGDPDRGRDLWIVAGMGKRKDDDPASVTSSAFRLEAHLSSGDDNDVWFQKGAGVIAKRTYHNGTYHDYRERLVRFDEVKQK